MGFNMHEKLTALSKRLKDEQHQLLLAGIAGGAVASFRSKARNSAGFLCLWIKAENVGAGTIGGGRGTGIQPSPCAGETGRW
jgi:hypothetical protein